MAKVELDTVEPNSPEFVEYLEAFGIKVVCVDENGPGGNWLLCEYRGTVSALEEMIHIWWDDDDLWEFIEDEDESITVDCDICGKTIHEADICTDKSDNICCADCCKD